MLGSRRRAVSPVAASSVRARSAQGAASRRSNVASAWRNCSRASTGLHEDSSPEEIAAALVQEIDRPLDYLPVPGDGAERAAAMISELLPCPGP